MKQTKIVQVATLLMLTAGAFLILAIVSSNLGVCNFPPNQKSHGDYIAFLRIKNKATSLKKYCTANNFCDRYAFLADMGHHSGKKRFYVYDFVKDTIVSKNLVARGSCNKSFLSNASFSNSEGCGCSSLGRYKVGFSYKGKFGKAYKLYGLDKTNSNAFDRNIVLHYYSCVPDKVTFPQPICNSLGCPMVSYNCFRTLSRYIDASKKPIILWIFD